MPSSLCTRELEICGLKLFLSSLSPQFLFLSLLRSLSGLTMSPLSKFILRLPYKDNQVMEFYQQVDKGIKAVPNRTFSLFSTTGLPTKMGRNGGYIWSWRKQGPSRVCALPSTHLIQYPKSLQEIKGLLGAHQRE